MKYFLDCDTMYVHIVPKKFWQYIDIINNHREVGDYQVNEAKDMITKNCKRKLFISALTQTL